jgi:hypothetical protein
MDRKKSARSIPAQSALHLLNVSNETAWRNCGEIRDAQSATMVRPAPLIERFDERTEILVAKNDQFAVDENWRSARAEFHYRCPRSVAAKVPSHSNRKRSRQMIQISCKTFVPSVTGVGVAGLPSRCVGSNFSDRGSAAPKRRTIFTIETKRLQSPIVYGTSEKFSVR